MVRHGTTHIDATLFVEKAKKQFEERYIKSLLNLETEDMTDNTQDKKVYTADELYDALSSGTYFSKCKDYILEASYKDIVVHNNPARSSKHDDEIMIDKELADEISSLTKFLDAYKADKASKCTLDSALNKINGNDDYMTLRDLVFWG